MATIPRCRSCGRDLDRRPGEALVTYRARRICSMTDCTGQGAIRPDYPGAVRLAEVPPRCPRDGGPWRRIEDGLSCVSCGRHVAVVEALLRAAGAPLPTC